MKYMLVISIIMLIFIAFNADKKTTKIKSIVKATSLLEPSLGVDEFNSRYLKRASDEVTVYPLIVNFKTMDTIYE